MLQSGYYSDALNLLDELVAEYPDVNLAPAYLYRAEAYWELEDKQRSFDESLILLRFMATDSTEGN